MSALRNPTTPARSTTSNRIILPSAFRRERHATTRQERAGKNLRRMSRLDDSLEKTGDRRPVEAAEDPLDE
jgi:hypothetical protein